MKFTLVSPPTVTEFNRHLAESDAILRLAEHAPVGVLTLAAVLERMGITADVVDMNQMYYDFLRECREGTTDFCSYSIQRLVDLQTDVIGFGTICSSYPLTLRITEGIKSIRPETTVILGGPQASVVDVATLHRFSAVDYIVRFEAENSLPLLLDVVEEGSDPSEVPGVTFRRAGQVHRTPNAPVISDLDGLPMPAFHRYPYLRQARYIPLELGRGCPYGCSFCSTNDYFRRKYRLKSPGIVVQQMSQLKAEYGIAIFDLIHDMFTVDRAKVVEFCEALLASGEEFYWNCSARTDRIDDELISIMHEAGCRGIFFGIETGSPRLQKLIKKRLHLPDAMARVRAASECGIQVAASLITGFPDETEADFADTVAFFADALRYENALPQLHILAPLADTPIHREYRDKLVFDDIMSDMSHQGWDQDHADRELISHHPEIFPSFYAVPTPLNRPFIKDMRAFLLSAARALRWILVALHQETGDLVAVFKRFQEWRERKGEGSRPSSVDGVPYFQSTEFTRDLLEFIEDQYREGSSGPGFLALVTYARAFNGMGVEDPRADLVGITNGEVRHVAFGAGSVPALAPSVALIEVEIDFEQLMWMLVEGRGLRGLKRERRRLASRKLPGRWPEVLQLSPMAEALLELCDGYTPVAKIQRHLVASSPPKVDGIPIDKACLLGLELLRADGLIEDKATTPARVA
jgi:radical SAM superfamily enzyme YgiQ (UPF0313 family)